MSDLKDFQRSLNRNEEQKSHFVNKDNSDSESSDSESETVRLSFPKKTKTTNPIDTMIMEQLIKTQKSYLKAQKTIYKLQTEIDTEEVKTRYLKLDLNNAQVHNEELKRYVMRFYYACAVIFFLLSVFSARIIF